MEYNKSNRNLNGYIVVYKPEHPNAMRGGNWDGYIYEHILVAEEFLGRPLRDNEVVHHLDFNRSNNRHENLLVLERGQHGKLHAWLDKGAPGWEQPGKNWVNSEEPKSREPKFCDRCSRTLQDKQTKFCSEKCSRIASRKVINRPSYEELCSDIASMSMETIARKHGVSSNAVRKWLKDYERDMATLSQAEGTPSEGAETSGAVKSA